MNQDIDLDIAALRQWIGRTELARDVITPRLVDELNATLDVDAGHAQGGSLAPLATHWCLAPPAARASLIGPDGHPARGGFLPPVPLPRRMWAGGSLRFHDRLRVGDIIERTSRIADVTMKEGSTGRLCFVAVDHAFHSPRGLAIEERQDIVYRDIQVAAATKTPPPAPLPTPQWRRAMRADPVLLFRYSALTFNGHRIHYDRAYVTQIEAYHGLIVHGPLQATLLIDFAAHVRGSAPKHFNFRGVQPLFDFMNFALCASETQNGLDVWVQTDEGVKTMDAQAIW
ncbi:MAG: protein dehydratase [Rhodospirillales bacterium 20-60-12]|nr:MAG: protein dehydratase [Rhodospirillales bacterium 20-60-12]HQT66701.1 MaoC family dehydratase N-terminal domain-containing protein [Acetobacteraceae bacterium]